ncbi:hypothetical protein FSW04_09850 [Baekduia soli]|uniref:Pilus assembly protein TadE n=1 Tax=Baekduia soli TaxID=496014 RepID=A0A5B8U5C2_9ACTN|nr:hypothetical protein [Baekduia soli]QEC47842.1 hypothetical protein FSW04_09850 [Baekduia soli]
MRASAQDGQAGVELVALLPVVVLVVLAVAQLLAAGAAREAAGAAAQAGAMARRQGGDPAAAVRAAAPGWARDRVSVRVTGRRVDVRIVPRALLPGAGLLAARAHADAGPPA